MIFDEGYFEENNDLDSLYVCRMQENHENGVTTPAHIHDFVEFLYGVDCECSVYADNQVYDFKNNEFIVFKSKQIHKVITKWMTNSRYIYIKVKIDAIYSSNYSSLDFKYILPFILNNMGHKCHFTEEELKGTGIPEAIWEIYNESQKQEYGYEITITGNLHKIYAFLLRQWHSERENKSIFNEMDETRISEVLKYIEENYQNELSADEVAKKCHVSYSYFSRWFKKITGKTFIQYVNYVRINHAEQLLMNSDYNITEISMQTGFPTTSYFIKQFKLQKGYSPGKFRKMIEDIEAEK